MKTTQREKVNRDSQWFGRENEEREENKIEYNIQYSAVD